MHGGADFVKDGLQGIADPGNLPNCSAQTPPSAKKWGSRPPFAPEKNSAFQADAAEPLRHLSNGVAEHFLHHSPQHAEALVEVAGQHFGSRQPYAPLDMRAETGCSLDRTYRPSCLSAQPVVH
jgi:hypothetical protein